LVSAAICAADFGSASLPRIPSAVAKVTKSGAYSFSAASATAPSFGAVSALKICAPP
jgi:hypothetical protein